MSRLPEWLKKSRWPILLGVFAIGLAIAIYVWIASAEVAAFGYTLVTVVVGLEIYRRTDDLQRKTHALLLNGVDSRPKRTQKIIEICRDARTSLSAVTVMPAVGILDDIATTHAHLDALERALRDFEATVSLISLSFADAHKYCDVCEHNGESSHERTQQRHDTLDWVEKRFDHFRQTYGSEFSHYSLPASGLSFQLYASESCALLYVVDPMRKDKDMGRGVATEDPRVQSVVEDGFRRMLATAMLTVASDQDVPAANNEEHPTPREGDPALGTGTGEAQATNEGW